MLCILGDVPSSRIITTRSVDHCCRWACLLFMHFSVCRICKRTVGCNFFTYITSNSNCFLKSRKITVVTDSNKETSVVSGQLV